MPTFEQFEAVDRRENQTPGSKDINFSYPAPINAVPCVAAKRVLWVKARPDYEPLFLILDGLCPDAERRYWKGCCEAQGNNSNTEADTGQMSTGVEIQLPMSHNFLTKTAEQVK
jgi:hypothetical protein